MEEEEVQPDREDYGRGRESRKMKEVVVKRMGQTQVPLYRSMN